MGRTELAVEKVKRLNEEQTEALLEWLKIRESSKTLRKHLDDEIQLGLDQLKRGEGIPSEKVHAEIRIRSQERRMKQNG